MKPTIHGKYLSVYKSIRKNIILDALLSNYFRLLILVTGISVLVAGCSKDSELRRSVFVEDSEAPGLPEYSEWGYNTFGVYYDRLVFRSNDNDVPAKIEVDDTTFNLAFNGTLTENTYYNGYDAVNFQLRFVIKDYQPKDYKDLVDLNGTKFDLTSNKIKVVKIYNNTSDTLKIYEGELNFKRAQHLFVDGTSSETILSGYFDMKAKIGNSSVTLSEGRFDVGISGYNFFLDLK